MIFWHMMKTPKSMVSGAATTAAVAIYAPITMMFLIPIMESRTGKNIVAINGKLDIKGDSWDRKTSCLFRPFYQASRRLVDPSKLLPTAIFRPG